MVSRVVVLNDASLARGGATGLALLSIRELRTRGYEVTYIVGDTGDLPELVDLGVEVVAVGGRQLIHESKLKAASRGIYNMQTRKIVSDWIERNDRPDTVFHLHGWSKILSPSVFNALRKVASRTVIHAHDFFLVCPNGAFMDYQAGLPCARTPLGPSCLTTHCDKRTYVQKLWRVGRQTAALHSLGKKASWANVVMIHDKMAPYFEKAGWPSSLLVTVRNPVEPFHKKRIQAEMNRDFFFIGRVEAEKGIEDLIAAATRAEISLKVIGDGPLRETLALKHPSVTFFGWRSREEIAQLIKTARALVMPSRYPEPYGLVAVEAAGSGLPVILSKTAFLSEEMEKHGVAFVCDGRDHKNFITLLARMRDLPKCEIQAMSERAFAQMYNFGNSVEAWMGELLSLYSVAEKAPKTPFKQRLSIL